MPAIFIEPNQWSKWVFSAAGYRSNVIGIYALFVKVEFVFLNRPECGNYLYFFFMAETGSGGLF